MSDQSRRIAACARWTQFAGAAVLIVAAGALAQSPPEWKARTSEPAPERAATFIGANSESMLEIVTSEGTFQVRMTGDDVVALLNGTRLPPNRVRIGSDAIVLLDQDEKPIATMSRPRAGDVAMAPRGRAGGFSMSGEFRIASPRMIGVVTNPVDGALAAQLGIEPHKALVISAVAPGLPAEAAGLRPYDVVTAIDGATPATLETLRAALADKSIGQTVALTIVRQGDPMQIAVQFTEPDNATVADRVPANVRALAGDSIYAWRPEGEVKVAPDVEREVREWVKDYWVRSGGEAVAPELRLHERLKVDEERRRQLERSMRVASAALEQLDIQSELPEISFVGPEGRDVALFPRGSARAIAGAASERELAARLRQVEARLMRLEQLLQTIIELDPQTSNKVSDPKSDAPSPEPEKTGT